jgi:hypothetical protein
MEGIRDLLRLLTEAFPPAGGMRHAITVADGFDDVKDMENINLVISLATSEGFLPVYLPDEDLVKSAHVLFDEIIELLHTHDLIEDDEQLNE